MKTLELLQEMLIERELERERKLPKCIGCGDSMSGFAVLLPVRIHIECEDAWLRESEASGL